MGNVFAILIFVGLLAAVIQGMVFFSMFAAGVLLLIIAVALLSAIARRIRHHLNPAEKVRYVAEKEAVARRKIAAEAAKQAREAARRADHRFMAESAERARRAHRDADRQDEAYVYQIGTHGNESLAIRYGIANNTQKSVEHWYTARGGEQKRNPSRDRKVIVPCETICLQKLAKVDKDMYRVQLKDYSDRIAIAVVEAGTEYVKTFYPLDKNWFEKQADLELTLKGNGTFTLKELATFHVQKAVGSVR